ncbi:MAG TPA: hypothetical protein VFU43_12310 [Streptosporangiaceae bacterium]|nr:hypothetical protein [Streptosporangiaceae bacterium]
MNERSSRRSGPARSGADSHERPDAAAARDFDAEGRPLPRQEDEAPGTGAPGVDVGRPDAAPAEDSGDERPA